MKIFAQIVKRDDEKRMVYGYASTEVLDAQGEKISKAAIEAALPDYMRFANIREMHQLSAVGVAKSADMDDKGLYLQAKIVDDAAWEKVKEGVYKGFSIGGRTVAKVDGVITELKLNEISLVDRPANPEAVIEMWKSADDPADAKREQVNELAKLVNEGADLNALLKTAKDDLAAKAAPVDLLKALRIAPTDLAAATELLTKAADVIEKAGAKFSASSKEKLAAAHGQIKKAAEHAANAMSAPMGEASGHMGKCAKCIGKADGCMDDVGYDDQQDDDDDKPQQKTIDADDVVKVATQSAVTLLKADLAKRDETIDALSKRLKALEDLPLPAKGPTRAIGKEDDTVPGDGNKPNNGVAPVLKEDGSVDEDATAMKKVHSAVPMFISTRQPSAYYRPRQ